MLVVPPTVDAPASVEAANVLCTAADGEEGLFGRDGRLGVRLGPDETLAVGRGGLPVVVAAPAHDSAVVLAYGADMVGARADSGEPLALGKFDELIAPARGGAIHPEPAPMVRCDGDGREALVVRTISFHAHVAVTAPTDGDAVLLPQPAGVSAGAFDRDERVLRCFLPSPVVPGVRLWPPAHGFPVLPQTTRVAATAGERLEPLARRRRTLAA